jgi:hypothetical protein
MACIAGFFLLAGPARGQSIIYVKAGANGTTGSDWPNAFGDLQSGINAAALLAPAQVWVASGMYKPGANSTDSFQVINQVSVIGGFFGTAGTEGNPNARDPDPATNGLRALRRLEWRRWTRLYKLR